MSQSNVFYKFFFPQITNQDLIVLVQNGDSDGEVLFITHGQSFQKPFLE